MHQNTNNNCIFALGSGRNPDYRKHSLLFRVQPKAGEETSISALSAQLKGYKSRHIAPGAHWLYKEKLLSDIYDETYPFEE